MHDEIKEALEANEDPTYTFEKNEGIKQYFKTDMEDQEEAAAIAKQIIKDDVSSVIMFKVRTEEYL